MLIQPEKHAANKREGGDSVRNHCLWAAVLFMCLSLFPEPAGASDKVLRVAFDKELPPFAYMDENGKASGFNIDLIKAIAEENGYELEYVPLEWEDALSYLKDGKVDVLLGIKYTNRYDLVFDFSESFFTMSEVLLVPKQDSEIFTLNQLREKVVAVQRGNVGMDLLESVRRVKMLVSFNQRDALDNLIRGRADAFIGNRWTAEYLLEKANKQDEFVMRSGLINPTDYAFAVREGNYELLDKINEGLNKLYRDGTYTRLYSHYFEPYATHATDRYRKVVIGLLVVMALVSITLVTIFFWNKRLKAEVRRQTAALADVMAFQRQVLDNTESAILSLDVFGHITLVNQVTRRLLLTDDDAIGRHISALLPQLPVEQALAADKPSFYEGEFQLEQSSVRVFHYYMAPFGNAVAEHVGWIVSLQDRTEQKRLQARLISQEKMHALGQLAAGMAHELRNPLTAIKTFIDMLPKKLDDERFRSELLHYVPEEMERMNRILEDLLDYSRSKPLEIEETDLKMLVDSVLGLFAKRAVNEQVEMHIEVPQGIKVCLDRRRLKQVLINLMINALEAMSTSSVKRLHIKARESADGVELTVSDTGEGMSAEQLPHLFEPFFTTKTQGIGLGLYVSDKIMREHGGRIDVSSTKGEGTTFTLFFQ
ncbi:transporter substrate-binding domain-containing protein [Brevibacillus borstelensis]|uniref:transporter substrate-binding domain-containing protein n=1 Tax=Brevibacillus borstelensis TaxID=45462 RepID=UPI002E1AA892|nr:transporter substrate-binding domain-containing protein [Brevibacillus borstelensis]MED2007546.1 transporter substrate-binding domain-containing protein [Brevibacillus borstelensis]